VTRAEFERLRRDWYERAHALARSRGERDIETPPVVRGDGTVGRGGQFRGIANRPIELPPEAASDIEAAASAELAAKRRFLETHRFASGFERAVWAGHCDGLSARAMAGQVGRRDRKSIDRAMGRLLAAFRATSRRPAHRPRDPHSLRSEGMTYCLRLSPAAALAMDHLREFLVDESPAEIMRRALVETAKKVPAYPTRVAKK